MTATTCPSATTADDPTQQTPPRTIGLGQAIAIYVGAVLGAGVLVLPGQAASLAGPASLLAWAFVGLLGLPLALTFAALATRYPDAGGVATYASRAFGTTAGGVTGWMYFLAGSVGQTIVPLTGGYYVAAVAGGGAATTVAVASGILGTAVAANLFGLRLSGRLQLGLAGGVALILLAATIAALPHLQPGAFSPFAPHGVAGIGRAVIVLFFAFAGWEAVTHLSAEFSDVSRDLRRATMCTVVVVLTLYLGVSFAVIGTSSYGSAEADRVAVGAVFADAFGFTAAAAAAGLAVVVSLGTTNAFVASVSRLGYALGREGWLPSAIRRRNRYGVPHVGVLALGGIGGAGLAVSWLFGWGTEDLMAIPSSLVLATYLVGMGAGVRLLPGRSRLLAGAALVLCVAVLPFAGSYLLVPALVVVVAFIYRFTVRSAARV